MLIRLPRFSLLPVLIASSFAVVGIGVALLSRHNTGSQAKFRANAIKPVKSLAGIRGGIPPAPKSPPPAAAKKKTPQVLGVQDIQQPTPPPDTYQVKDEFVGTTLDSSLWEVMTYAKGYRNNEEQDYTPSQVKVADGRLQITASRDQNGNWHSGEVHSKWNYTYGEFEVRLALSATGPGVWPAAWLMGTTDQWPVNGEIDIFESINGAPTVYGTIHAGGANGHWQTQSALGGVDVTAFHTYKIVKIPGLISWWVDGVKRGEWPQSTTPAGGVWPFENHRNFGLLNLAIGGNWPGPSNALTPDNIIMYVDYFSVKNGS
jgi:beta-glucanase (GH16 family)